MKKNCQILQVRHIAVYALLLLVGVVVFIFSYSLQWTADDICFQFNFANGEPLVKVSDIAGSQYWHYMNCNGRFLWHAQSQLYTAFLGHLVFGVVNALMYILLIILTVKLVKGDVCSFGTVLSTILLLLFMCDTHYVPSCQIGFIWGAAITLGFVMLLCVDFSPEGWRKVVVCILLGVYSYIAGGFCEVYSVGVSCALGLYALLNMRKVTAIQWIMILMFWIGCAVLCLSPGSMNRAAGMHISLITSISRFVVYSKAIYIFVVLVIIYTLKGWVDIKAFVSDNMYYFVAMAALLAFAFIVGLESNRQIFGVELICVILTLRLLRGHTFRPLVLVAFSIVVICIFIAKWQQISDFNRCYYAMVEKIKSHDDPDEIIFQDFPARNVYVHATRSFAHGEGSDYETNSIQALLNSHYHSYPLLKVLPACVDSILRLPVENRVIEYLPDRYVLFRDKRSPQKFVHHRQYNIFGIRRPFPDYEVSFDTDLGFSTEDYDIAIVSYYVPFIEDIGVEIK